MITSGASAVRRISLKDLLIRVSAPEVGFRPLLAVRPDLLRMLFEERLGSPDERFPYLIRVEVVAHRPRGRRQGVDDAHLGSGPLRELGCRLGSLSGLIGAVGGHKDALHEKVTSTLSCLSFALSVS